MDSQTKKCLTELIRWKETALTVSRPPPETTRFTQTLPPGRHPELAVLLAQALLPPCGSWEWYETENSSSKPGYANQVAFVTKWVPVLVDISVRCLSGLMEKSSDQSVSEEETKGLKEEKDDPQDNHARFVLAVSLSCYLYKGYPWTDPQPVSPDLSSVLSSLFERYPQYVESLYSDYVRPAFDESADHPRVSAAGRQRLSETHPDKLSHTFSVHFMEESKAAWKTTSPHSLALLETYLRHCGPKMQTRWSFFVPCILNVLDFHEPAYKRKGAELVTALADNVPATFFRNTGVAPVFWDALSPALSFVPPSTPAVVAVPLAQAAFGAMMALSYLSMPGPGAKVNSGLVSTAAALQLEFLNTAIVRPFSLGCKSVPMLIQLLNETTVLLNDHLHAEATPDLSVFVDIVVGTLCDPLVSFSEELMGAAVRLLKSVESVMWFRVGAYRYDILRGIVFAARAISKEEDGMSEMRTELRECVDLLVDAVKRSRPEDVKGDLSSFGSEIGQLKVKETAFKELFLE